MSRQRTQFLIEIRNEAPKKYRFTDEKIRKAASKILTALGWKKASVSLWITGDRKIKTLNNKFLGHNWATDVISFSQWEGRRLKSKVSSESDIVPLGDLIVSVETAERQGREYGNSVWYEFCFYLCHGILHLMGKDDKTPREAKQMERKQTQVLKKIKIFRNAR